MQTKTLAAALVAAMTLTMAGASAAQSTPRAASADATTTAKPAGERQRAHSMRGHRGHGGNPVDALARFDTDNDGRISRAEAQAAQTAMQARRDAKCAERPAREGAGRPATRGEGARRGPGGPRPHAGRGFDLVANFDAIDRNGDGYLTRGELRTWHEAKAVERRAERERRFDTMFREADLNGDGKLSRVEVAEKMPRLVERFAWMDENGDGFLSREELQAGRPQR